MAHSNPLPTMQSIDPNDEPSMTRLLDGIASAFSETRISRAFITEKHRIPPPYPSPSFNVARIRSHVEPAITHIASEGAELVQAGDFSAIAIWETTSYRGESFSALQNDPSRPIRMEWTDIIADQKNRHIGMETKSDGSTGLKPFYHLGFLVRNPNVEPAVKGAISAVVRPFLERAEKEGVPVWLEATYEHAVEIYTHFGFRLIEVVAVGKGKVDEEGWPREGGSGVNAWIMIYDGHLK